MVSISTQLPEEKIEYNIFEINEQSTSDAQKKFAKEIADLEKFISLKLFEEGKGEEFFPSGYDDICDYIIEDDTSVMVCQDENKKIIAASYIIKGNGLYTYNDLSKYFKFNKEYIEYAKSKYDPNELCLIEYETYMKKIEGYKIAKECIIKELNIHNLIEHCKTEKEKGTFDEKNKVREKVNRYIYYYFRDNSKDKIGLTELDRFYLLKFSDLQKCENSDIRAKCENETKENKELYKEYDELLDLFDLSDAILPDEKDFKYLKREDFKTYFDSNPFNTIKLDTYIVHPDYRRKGLAKIVTFEGLKIQLDKLLEKKPNLEEIFISSTIHQKNNLSKKITNFFGDNKFDTIYIKRRNKINREIYFYKIQRKNLNKFIKNNEEKIKKLKFDFESEYNIVLK